MLVPLVVQYHIRLASNQFSSSQAVLQSKYLRKHCLLSVNMRKETFPEDEADWIMVDRESPSEITNLPENDVASFSSGDQCWSIEKAKGSETDDVKKIIPTMPKKT